MYKYKYLCYCHFVLLGNLLDHRFIKDTWVIIILHRTSGTTQRRVGLKHNACIANHKQKTSTNS